MKKIGCFFVNAFQISAMPRKCFLVLFDENNLVVFLCFGEGLMFFEIV